MIRCWHCGTTLSETRGRGKGARRYCCGKHECRKHIMRANSKDRQNRFVRDGLTTMGTVRQRQPNLKFVSERALTTLMNKQWLRDEMFRRGKCAYHVQYFGTELLVHDDHIEVFEFDHVDRTRKHSRKQNISRMVKRNTLPELQVEVAFCELVCSNCHRIKTQRNKDFTAQGRVIQEHPQLTLE